MVCNTTTLAHRCRRGRPPHQPERASVSALIEAAGARLLFLPPYRPDFNPIEKAFARLKAMLRKAGERTVSGLWSLIGKLVDLFQPRECANYFSSCGYDPD
jgi:transposase